MRKYLLLAIVVFSLNTRLFSQVQNPSYNFGKAYYLLTKSDDVNNFFVVDFTKFPSDFEKIYFKNLVYKSKVIVSIDSDLTKGVGKFQANKKFDLEIVNKSFDEMVEKTINANSTMDSVKKDEWIKKNTK